MKVELLRDCGLGKGKNGVEGEVIELDDHLGKELIICGAAKKAAEDAKEGKPKATKG